MTAAPTPRRLATSLAAVVATISVVLLAAVALDAFPLGVPGEWVYPHNAQGLLPLAEWVACVFLAAAAAAVAVGYRMPFSPQYAIPRLSALLLLGFAFDWNVLAAGRAGAAENLLALFDRYATGYLESAAGITSTTTYLRDFRNSQEAITDVNHVNAHPPGRILFSKTILDVVRASPAMRCILLDTAPSSMREALAAMEENGFFPYLKTDDDIKAAAIALLYIFLVLLLLGKLAIALAIWELWGSTAALSMGCLYLFVPSPLLFLGHYDFFLASLGALLLWLGIVAARRATWPLPFALGAYSTLCLTFSIAFGVPCLWLGLFWLLEIGVRRKDWRRLLFHFILPYAGGIVLVLASLWLFFGFPLVSVCFGCLNLNSKFFAAQGAGRSVVWKLLNPVEWFASVGIPASLAALLCAAEWLRRRNLRGALAEFAESPAGPAAAASCAALLFLFLTPMRAEAARQWMVAWPIAYLLFAAVFRNLGDAARIPLIVLGLLQAAQILVFRFYVKLVLIDM